MKATLFSKNPRITRIAPCQLDAVVMQSAQVGGDIEVSIVREDGRKALITLNQAEAESFSKRLTAAINMV